ncbi:ATP-binding cassette domain-containing protein [Microlunatus soli]|uniref:Peptide/nickel transport system ATP-binding protein n=1 Tax=Microlunatus soli TaxID=630515 RepID=A0A1H1SIA4_9ACTN|nr:ATP-binding cassette domain-containing protein [Microlunatus soli]SDS47466.1 peptide/nickel transport system ATP-binding protein [Microlunatus soli]
MTSSTPRTVDAAAGLPDSDAGLRPGAQPILTALDLTKEFDTRGGGVLIRQKSRFRAVDGVSFDLLRGETLALVGESGSGKSTTARMIARLIEPTSGTVELDGVDVTKASGAALQSFRRAVQVVFQDPYSSLNPRHTAADIITAPLRYQRLPAPAGGNHRAYAQQLMERVGLNPDHASRHPAQFSGGQAQRIGIARAISVRPKIVICDEAVSALDVSVQAQVIDLLKDLQADEGFSYVFITHDLAVVRQIAHRVAVMQRGGLVELGTREQIFTDPQDDYTRTLLSAVPRIEFG